MSIKVYLCLLLILVSIFLFRLTISLTTKELGEVSGFVSSEPKFVNGSASFRLNHEFVFAKVDDLHNGDKISAVVENKGKYLFAAKIKLLDQGWLYNTSSKIREDLKRRIETYFPHPEADLLKGILLGIKSDLPDDFNKSLIATGTIHIVVVSGYNIALIGSFFLGLAGVIGRKKASIVSLLAIMMYTLLVGNSPPTLRAALMGGLSFSAIILGRQYQALLILFFTGLIILIFDPLNIIEISFQLTFLATLGVIVFTKYLHDLIHLPEIIKEPLSTTLAAQVLVIPLIFYYFGSISVSSPLVNTLVLWTVPLVTVLGFGFLLISFVSSFISGLLSFLLMIPLTYFVLVVKGFASLSIFYLKIGLKENLSFIVGYYLIVSSLVLIYKNSHQDINQNISK